MSRTEPVAMHPMPCPPDRVVRPMAALPAGVRARVWIEARHFFSRADARNRCWLWLARHDGRIRALVMPSHCMHRDDLLPDLVRAFDADPFEESLPAGLRDTVRALPDAPVVPLPRWQVSWGHPVQRAIREFAASLDQDVLHTLGDLETPGPFFGSVANYNRLATLREPVRTHRLQALTGFPPLVAPLLLDLPDRPDLFGDGHDFEPVRPSPRIGDDLLDAIDRGRDLIGALAAHFRVDRALVRSPLCRAPWASGAIPADALRLFAALPAHARPRHVKEAESRLRDLRSLPFATMRAQDAKVLATAFSQGWNETWSRIEAIGQPLQSSLRDTRDFLVAAVEQAALPDSLAGMPHESLGLAWAARRGLESLLLASKRWHAQPLVELPVPDSSAPCTRLERALEEIDLAGGRVEELLTEAALAEEGMRMHHCVADYWDDCLTEGTRIVHLQLPGGERATAEYVLQGGAHDPRFSLRQLAGPCNAAVSASMDHLAHTVLDLLNAPDQRERRVRVAESAHAALCQAHGQPVPRRTIRRLDPRSRRELAQVIAWCERQDDWKRQVGELFRGHVAGFRYSDGARLLHLMNPGDALTLVREPANPHDRHAVRVDWRGHKIGYVPRDHNRGIAFLMDSGEAMESIVVAVNHGSEPWTQVEMRVEHIEDDAAANQAAAIAATGQP